MYSIRLPSEMVGLDGSIVYRCEVDCILNMVLFRTFRHYKLLCVFCYMRVISGHALSWRLYLFDSGRMPSLCMSVNNECVCPRMRAPGNECLLSLESLLTDSVTAAACRVCKRGAPPKPQHAQQRTVVIRWPTPNPNNCITLIIQ